MGFFIYAMFLRVIGKAVRSTEIGCFFSSAKSSFPHCILWHSLFFFFTF